MSLGYPSDTATSPHCQLPFARYARHYNADAILVLSASGLTVTQAPPILPDLGGSCDADHTGSDVAPILGIVAMIVVMNIAKVGLLLFVICLSCLAQAPGWRQS